MDLRELRNPADVTTLSRDGVDPKEKYEENYTPKDLSNEQEKS